MQRLIEGRLAQLRMLSFGKVLELPARSTRELTVGRSRLEVTESTRSLPSGRVLVQVEVWRTSFWRKPALAQGRNALLE